MPRLYISFIAKQIIAPALSAFPPSMAVAAKNAIQKNVSHGGTGNTERIKIKIMVPLDFKLVTDRCVLSTVADEDLDHIWTATRHPGFNDGMLWDPPATREEISDWTERTLDLWRKGTQYTFSIRLKRSADFIGRIVIRSLRPEQGVWYLGYWIHPQHWNKGYATEAAAAMLDFGFSQLRVKRVESSHALWNKASAAVIRKLGMRFRGENPRGFMKRGEWVAEGEYYLDAEDFSP